MEDTRLKAPFHGYIQNKYYGAPEIVSAGTPVLSMINEDYFEVEVDIPAADFVRRSDFAGYSAIADAYPDRILPLELIDINRGANYNQLFHARFRLNRDSLPGLANGMSVAVTIDFKSTENPVINKVEFDFHKADILFVLLIPAEITVI